MTKHSLLAQQVDALLYNEPNLMANLANAAALLNDSLTDVNWVGFYLYNKSKNELDLGPFQGKVACMHIANGKGVVGTAFATQKTQVVADVHQFAGHIACDSATNAEIVVPLTDGDRKIGVLDIDSLKFDRFNADDQAALEEFAAVLVKHL
ncbi:GAF domain-containing protein [Loigolactobacillus coryniformis]|jgi:L-methionine (R)-S-oxide reductase|uniref:GAF domain protein n=3 Tax=Loigolactobacillus coryniformis TaxID=1610 RepID=J2YYL6_9LACO|nr:GAF domain-containing protein [Loigolactobacillus coryniformis]MDT3390764.1 GAF domain-containing protein [Bacillota bacterium]RRG07032.1 MAG: GAF domain-containing protein [Lactobacillus sp.]ATO43547.1 histidine kinase [Loigolactobacillus coryniformis subsp. torquens DSM 20004 = KCTC 3535]EJN53213.1 GAF domain protein [Loigolactobacillus coryniformis subsp. coryniformis CECT 5711]KRK85139.1 signal protein [Loigolactobacillus coryniformis subsp. torquens DSM 20004 = KCTC 3535]